MVYGWETEEILMQFFREKFMNILELRKPIIACVPDGAAKMAVEEYWSRLSFADPDNIDANKKYNS
ncbi:MAG: hypothetical protein MZV64_08505 [Ignavibacteriales bacterium]|nr:hypothetical protein [Ignavibacteriales bacterium]